MTTPLAIITGRTASLVTSSTCSSSSTCSLLTSLISKRLPHDGQWRKIVLISGTAELWNHDVLSLCSQYSLAVNTGNSRGSYILVYHYTKMTELGESTTVKVSKDTVRKLAALQRSLHTGSMDETIGALVRRRRKDALDAIAGTDRSRTRKFLEEDRLENRG